MRRRHWWIILACVGVLTLLMYPLLRETYFAFWVAPVDKYLSETRRYELSRFAEEMLKNSRNSELSVTRHWNSGPRADGPTSAAEIESIRELLRKHHLDRFRMDRRSGYVQYSYCFIRTWLHYIYVTNGGRVPTRPGSPNPKKVFENWYFAGE
jgi:hypothetical protein